MLQRFTRSDVEKVQSHHHKLVKKFRKNGKKRHLRKMETLGKELAASHATDAEVFHCHQDQKHAKDRHDMLPLLSMLTGYGHQLRKAKRKLDIDEATANREVNRIITNLLMRVLADTISEPYKEIESELREMVTGHVNDGEADHIDAARYPVALRSLITTINQEVMRIVSHRINQSDQSSFQRDLMLISDNLTVISSELAQCATTIHHQADDTNSKSSQSAQRTMEVSREMHEANEAMARLESAITGITRNIEEVSRACESAVREVNHTEQRMNALNEASQRAEGVVKTIHKIAAQTRMLAINATIEAQRAGELGRGFSVVAEEVKSLALASELGTHQVRQAIDEIQLASNSVSDAMHTIAEQISMTNNQLGDVSQIASLQKDASSRVSSIISGAITSADDTMQDFNQLDQGARTIRQEASNMDVSAQALRECIQELTTSVTTHTGPAVTFVKEEEAIDLF